MGRGGTTTTAAVPVTPAASAVITVEPSAWARTTPSESTDATAGA
jgi:hypothetical protein